MDSAALRIRRVSSCKVVCDNAWMKLGLWLALLATVPLLSACGGPVAPSRTDDRFAIPNGVAAYTLTVTPPSACLLGLFRITPDSPAMPVYPAELAVHGTLMANDSNLSFGISGDSFPYNNGPHLALEIVRAVNDVSGTIDGCTKSTFAPYALCISRPSHLSGLIRGASVFATFTANVLLEDTTFGGTYPCNAVEYGLTLEPQQ